MLTHVQNAILPEGAITKVVNTVGKYNDRWVVFGIHFGQERPVFESPSVFAATHWARKNGWGS